MSKAPIIIIKVLSLMLINIFIAIRPALSGFIKYGLNYQIN